MSGPEGRLAALERGPRDAAPPARPSAAGLYRALLRALPASFRREYGGEMVGVFRSAEAAAATRGAPALARFWGGAVLDLARSAARERGDAARRAGVRVARDTALGGGGDEGRPPYGAAALAGLAVWGLYVATLSPTTAFWDTSEYIAVGHVLGIPHPPGNPLFVLLARAWELLLAPLGLSVAVRINLLSAACSALAHALWFLVVERGLRGVIPGAAARRVGALVAVVVSATAFTVWSQSSVNEKVYTVSLLTVAAVSWLLLRWRDLGRPPRYLLLAAYLAVLSVGNHLMALLVVPAAVLFVAAVDRRALVRPRLLVGVAGLAALALSAHLYLPIRATHAPLINEADPSCASLVDAAASVYSWGRIGCAPLSEALTRSQYAKPPVGEDPTRPGAPRGPALIGAQLLQYAQYFDWQWARSLAGRDPLFGGARPLVSLLFLGLGLLGAAAHWRGDRSGALYMLALFLTLSLGLVAYLNFRYGFSIGWERAPDREMHEVRERDYFFVVGFSVWGLWAGMGLAWLWRRTAQGMAGRARRPALAAAPVLALALLPLALNWSYASRAGDHAARDWAYNLLMTVEPYGVLFTNGDNDTFPLWYLQEVEGLRRDVTVVVGSYLGTAWYVEQIRALTTPCPPGVAAADDPTRLVCQRPFELAELPPPLRAAGVGTAVRPPEDSIVPLTAEQVKRIAAGAFLVHEPLRLRAAGLDATIPTGTVMLPSDTFMTAVIMANLGRRPIYFTSPSPAAAKLGLGPYTVRHGLALRLSEGPVEVGRDSGIVALPEDAAGAFPTRLVDVARTDTLLDDVYLHRSGRPASDAPWPDPATLNIAMSYAQAHLAAAQAQALLGAERDALRHLDRATAWSALAR